METQSLYNRLGERVRQTANGATTHYLLDLNANLSQVLVDRSYTYLYDLERIAQYAGANPQYYLGDALGSVRQLLEASGTRSLYQSFDPFGNLSSRDGSGSSTYSFAGEWTSSYIKLLYLRSRYYSSEIGRFLTRDSWQGSNTRPLSLNKWIYVSGNPINFSDPSGYDAFCITNPEVCESFPDLAVQTLKNRLEKTFGLKLTSTIDGVTVANNVENWDEAALLLVEEVSNLIASKFRMTVDWRQVVLLASSPRRLSGIDLFRGVFGGLDIRRGPRNQKYVPGTGFYGMAKTDVYIAYGPSQIWYPGSQGGQHIILHEFGHIIDQRALRLIASDGSRHYNRHSTYLSGCTDLIPLINRIFEYELHNGFADYGFGTNSGLGVNRRTAAEYGEVWADLFASWVIDSFYHIEGQNDGTLFKNQIAPYMRTEVVKVFRHGIRVG